MTFLSEFDSANSKNIVNAFQNKAGYTAEQRMIAQRFKKQG